MFLTFSFKRRLPRIILVLIHNLYMDSTSLPEAISSELNPIPSTSTSTTTINYLPLTTPSTISSSSAPTNYTGPITASGEPSIDPTTTWEVYRSEWLNRQPNPSNLRSERDPILIEKLRVLESLLTDPPIPSPLNRLSTGGIGSSGMKGKGKMVEGEMMAEGEGEVEGVGEQIDGGEVIREKNDKIGEGILSSFRQGRALRNPVPLSIVVSYIITVWREIIIDFILLFFYLFYFSVISF